MSGSSSDAPPCELRRDEPLARYTAARMGGTADYLYIAREADYARTLELLCWAWARGMPVTVLGGGANVLIADAGIRGLTIINRATKLERDGARVIASSGSSLIHLARACQSWGLSGMEWAIAVPGTVGGAVVNNAGAHGGDIAGTLHRALIVEAEGGAGWASAESLEYAYRHSRLKSRSDRRFFVLRAEFQLRRDDKSLIEARMGEYNEYRKRTQPPGASLGSIFKNPPGDYAGRLIEAAGLKGYRVGAARVSPLHANFFVSRGGEARAADYLTLIRAARVRVREAFGVELELEIQLLGEWR